MFLQPELYLCTPIKIDFTKNYYITAFEPNATMGTTHHMLIYGCTKPGSSMPVWNCGEMAHFTDKQNMYGIYTQTAPPCGQGSQVTERIDII